MDQECRPRGLHFQIYDWQDVKKREKKDLAYKVDDFLELQKKVPFRDYGGSARLRLWQYTPEVARKTFGEASYVNNASLFLVYTWRAFKISIAGDLESDGMAGMVSTKAVQEEAHGTDVLIPSHHGHKNAFPPNGLRKWTDLT